MAVVADRTDLLRQLLDTPSFDEVTRLVFEHADLVDDQFVSALRPLADLQRRAIQEAVLRAAGVLADPQIVGPWEQRIIGHVVGDVLDGVRGDVRHRLALAVDGRFQKDYGTATQLAIVRCALDGCQDEVLLALGDITRGRILWREPERLFDAVQYLRRGTKALETEYERQDRNPAIEDDLMQACIELVEMADRVSRQRLERALWDDSSPDGKAP